jgi:peptidyl-tRNA hydrolase, PTH1 family
MKYLIAGLGNIGTEYANTRHNVGFEVTEALARLSGVSFQSGRYADVAKMRVKNKSLVLIKPTTYMNLSGKAVRYWLDAEKIPLENMLVVVDDIALAPGQLRLKTKGGDGGHNGLSSIIATLGTEEFARLRVGIGNDYAKGYQVDYVLGKWTKAEEEIMVPALAAAVDMIKSFVTEGAELTMTRYNK